MFGKAIIPAPARHNRLLGEVHLACEEIVLRWQTVDPPAAYDGPSPCANGSDLDDKHIRTRALWRFNSNRTAIMRHILGSTVLRDATNEPLYGHS